MSLLLLIRFEVRQQLCSHVFWIVFAISWLMVAGALWVPELRVGIGGDSNPSAAATVVRTHLLWSLFYMFTAAAFTADAVLRDTLTRIDPIIRSTSMPRHVYLLGRFAGGFIATAICFLSVPMALLLLPLDEAISWRDLSSSDFATGLLILALPNLFISATFFFVLTTRLRSMLGTLLGAVALLSLYGLGTTGSGVFWSLLEPFGFAAWSSSNWSLLLANRSLWLAVSAGALVALLFVREPREKLPTNIMPVAEEVITSPAVMQLPSPRFGSITTLVQLAHRTRFELRQILWSPAFVVLLIMGLGNAAAVIWQLHSKTASASPQATVTHLIDAFDLVPIVVVIFFAGETVWNDREHRVQELIGASALPNSALLLPKYAALGLALAGLAAASAGAALAVPRLLDATGPTVAQLVIWYVLPRTFDWLLLGALAFFLQVVSPNKIAGWGWVVLYLIVSLALDQAGYRDPIYHYGRYPGYPLPEALSGAQGSSWYRACWGALALVLLKISVAMASRGNAWGLGARRSSAGGRLRG